MNDREITIRLPEPAEAREVGDYEGCTILPASQCGGWREDTIGCGGSFEDGDPIRRVRGEWVHPECARKAITSQSVTDAWLLLAEQIADRPSAFRASDIRAVLRNVTDIAYRGLADEPPSSSRTNGDQETTDA